MLNTAIPDHSVADAMPAAFRVALRTLEAWDLRHDEMARALGLEPRTLYRYKRSGLPQRSMAPDLVERVSYILGIEKALEILLGGDREADDIAAWVNQPSDALPFAGRPPKQRLISGRVADLFVVREYLDGWRGGDFA